MDQITLKMVITLKGATLLLPSDVYLRTFPQSQRPVSFAGSAAAAPAIYAGSDVICVYNAGK